MVLLLHDSLITVSKTQCYKGTLLHTNRECVNYKDTSHFISTILIPNLSWKRGIFIIMFDMCQVSETNMHSCIGLCYTKLFEAAKIHVQIMRFTCCLNMAFNLTKPISGP